MQYKFYKLASFDNAERNLEHKLVEGLNETDRAPGFLIIDEFHILDHLKEYTTQENKSEQITVFEATPVDFIEPNETGKYYVNKMNLRKIESYDQLKIELIDHLLIFRKFSEKILRMYTRANEIKMQEDKINNILTTLNAHINVFSVYEIGGRKIIKADVGKSLKKEILDLQEKLSKSLSEKKEDVDELAHYYNNAETDYDKNCSKIKQQLNEAIMLYNIDQQQYHKLNAQYDLAINEDVGFIYITKFGELSYNYYGIYLVVLSGFAEFVHLNLI